MRLTLSAYLLGIKPFYRGSLAFWQRLQELCKCPAGQGVTPIRRDIGKRHQDERTLGEARMRQQGPALFHPAIIVQQIDIQCTWCVGSRSEAPELRFECMQRGQQGWRIKTGFDQRHRIDESGL